MKNILSAQNVHFQTILCYPEIDISKGVATFISGGSGCGKSTLLRLFNGTVSPSSGQLLFKGEDIQKIDTLILREKVLLAAQDTFLFDGTIEDNFIYYFAYKDQPVPDKEKMQRFLSICGGDFPLNTPCNIMSGGEKQRIFLGIHLSFGPEVLMLDEPTSALDENIAHLVLSNIKKFCLENHITLLVVSHDKNLMDTFADEIIYLKKGEHL